MVTLSSRIRLGREASPSERQRLIEDLADFEAGLQCLDCYSEVFANLAGTKRILDSIRRLDEDLTHRAAWMEHMEFGTTSQVSPELAGFAQKLKREHEDLRERLRELSAAVEQLRVAEDLYDAISRVKEQGSVLARQIGHHLALEESEVIWMSSFAPAPHQAARAGRVTMGFDKREMIETLELETLIVERGGYQPSVREPHGNPRAFHDSITCLNVGLEKRNFPCSDCFLIEFVPPEKRNEPEPCHHIPLNQQGDTVASLQGDRDRLEEALLGWLHSTVARLKRQVAQGG